MKPNTPLSIDEIKATLLDNATAFYDLICAQSEDKEDCIPVTVERLQKLMNENVNLMTKLDGDKKRGLLHRFLAALGLRQL